MSYEPINEAERRLGLSYINIAARGVKSHLGRVVDDQYLLVLFDGGNQTTTACIWSRASNTAVTGKNLNFPLGMLWDWDWRAEEVEKAFDELLTRIEPSEATHHSQPYLTHTIDEGTHEMNASESSTTQSGQRSPELKVVRIAAIIGLVAIALGFIYSVYDITSKMDTQQPAQTTPTDAQNLDTAVRTAKLLNRSFEYQGLKAKVTDSVGDLLVLSLENEDGGFKLITLKLETVEDIFAKAQGTSPTE